MPANLVRHPHGLRPFCNANRTTANRNPAAAYRSSYYNAHCDCAAADHHSNRAAAHANVATADSRAC